MTAWGTTGCFKKTNYIGFDVHVTVHRDKFLITKLTKCTNFSNFTFGMKLYMFRTVPLSIIRNSSLYTQQWYMLYRFADSCEQDQDGTAVPSWYYRVTKLMSAGGGDGILFRNVRIHLQWNKHTILISKFKTWKTIYIIFILFCSYQ